MPVEGLLNVAKPAGWTSHDVVAWVRRLLRTRVGHAGTLDPLATGVLVLCLGRATRLSSYLMHTDKLYRATIRLGVQTDTDDAEGEVIAHAEVPAVDEATLRAVLSRFEGTIEQRVPRYAAVKRGGKPLYRLARSGRLVDPPVRRVQIYAIKLLQVDLPDVQIEVHCGSGTYIRALARDVGEALGCGGHLAALVRLRSGPFALSDAVTLEQIEAALSQGTFESLVVPAIGALAQVMPKLTLEPRVWELLRHGRPVGMEAAPSDEEMCACLSDGRVGAIVRFRAETGLWHPVRVFDPPL